uniref:Peptidase S8/S53 domain-containing protein n=1 Tax=Fagus sylvatica TaxID=28930 RepID=A0A2N9J9R9_FAGSY
MLDTGIWPESQSFNDEGFSPPPKRWKGICQNSSNFTCNNKIIGARYYRSNGRIGQHDFASPRDSEGHGTHTASTAAGNLVSGASLLGLGSGTARGGVPSARIAVYKICWSDGCFDADILAAFDDAINDGNGILTSNSAGNSGPAPATITNFSPWSLSVAASTIDRKFMAKVKLGNGEVYEGLSINTFELENKMFPIVYGGDAPNTKGGFSPSQSSDEAVLATGAVGTIMADTESSDVAFSFPLPNSCLSLNDDRKVKDYYNSSRYFPKSLPLFTKYDIASQPVLTAPGADILAALSEASTVTGIEGDTRVVPYNIISGTSMSCPHATAAAAYIKSFHPTWSPAAVKSALMTTGNP